MGRFDYFWDFFGPTAETSARHFEGHLSERLSSQLEAEGEFWRTDVKSARAGHFAALVTVDDGRLSVWIESDLRPNRKLPSDVPG